MANARHSSVGRSNGRKTPPKKAAPAKAASNTAGADTAPAAPEGERIAKVLARAGVASRRGAETLIAQGRVSVDGRTLSSPALNVRPDQRICVDGEPIPQAEPTRLWRYHKPLDLLVTREDPQGRATIFEHLPTSLPRVITVGRLDVNSEGLLLLTNDGDLARRLELPATGWTRRYRARVRGEPQAAALARLAEGVTVDGERFAPITVEVERRTGANAWLSVRLQEGKNREVRRALDHIGLSVNRLIRVSYGPFQLGRMPVGEVEEVPKKTLQEQLGAFLKHKAR